MLPVMHYKPISGDLSHVHVGNQPALTLCNSLQCGFGLPPNGLIDIQQSEIPCAHHGNQGDEHTDAPEGIPEMSLRKHKGIMHFSTQTSYSSYNSTQSQRTLQR